MERKTTTYGEWLEKQEMQTHEEIVGERKGELTKFFALKQEIDHQIEVWKRVMSGTEGRRVGLCIT